MAAVLTRAHRLTSRQGYARAIRTGRRAGSRTVVVHARIGGEPLGPARIGLVVSKAVGGAVERNRVKRRLRHLLRDRVQSVPEASVVVVRALAPAAVASYAELGADLDAALARALPSSLGSGRPA